MRRFILPLFFIALTFPAEAPAQDQLDAPQLERAIEKVLRFGPLRKSKVGIHAVDVETGEVVYSMNADEPFNPASNVKLITAATALEKIGPEFAFGTRLSVEKVDDGVVKGPLYIKSEGNPLILWEDLLAWAAELRARGITKIEGGIVVDDTEFGDDFIPPGFDQKDEDASYRAPIGAVSLNFNSQTIVVRPGQKGGKAKTYMLPPNDNVKLVNEVKTFGGGRARLSASSEANDGGTEIVVKGSIGVRAEPQYVRKRIDNPSLFTGSALQHALEVAGLEVGGEVKRGQRPPGTKTLIYHRSKPLAYIVFLMNKWSNNFMAEMLFRFLGRDGEDSVARSRQVITDFMKETGVDTKGFVSFNGSGLYDGNQVTPRQLVGLLDYMEDQPTYPEFAAALAVAGTDGTLKSRLRKAGTRGTLRGKTGTLNEVTALSGYLETRSGRRLAYSILINDPPIRAWRLRGVQDELAEALASFNK